MTLFRLLLASSTGPDTAKFLLETIAPAPTESNLTVEVFRVNGVHSNAKRKAIAARSLVENVVWNARV